MSLPSRFKEIKVNMHGTLAKLLEKMGKEEFFMLVQHQGLTAKDLVHAAKRGLGPNERSLCEANIAWCQHEVLRLQTECSVFEAAYEKFVSQQERPCHPPSLIEKCERRVQPPVSSSTLIFIISSALISSVHELSARVISSS